MANPQEEKGSRQFGEILSGVEILRSGTHTASSGQRVTLTDEDLERIASGYDAAFHEAPVVIGHPAENAPAYGWVKSMMRAGDRLLATLDLVPEFVEAVRRGLFKKRSASLYSDLDGRGLYLRHVGFLGAVPPAVKALTDISLSDPRSALTIEFQEDSKMSWKERVKNLFTQAVDEIPEGGTPQQAAQPHPQFSEFEVKAREEAAAKKAREAAELEFAEKMKKGEAERAAERNRAAVKEKLDALEKAGKVLPAWRKAGLRQFLESLGHIDSIEFGEGGKKTPRDWFFSFLEELPKSIDLKEFAGRDRDTSGDPEQAREKAIQDYMEKHPAADYRTAVLTVSERNPELFRR